MNFNIGLVLLATNAFFVGVHLARGSFGFAAISVIGVAFVVLGLNVHYKIRP